MQLIARNKEKGPIVLDDVDTLADNKLSSGSSPSLNLSPVKNTRESIRTKLHKRPLPYLVFSDTVGGASRRARREASRRQYRPSQASRNSLVLPSGTLPPVPPTHPAFGTSPTFYVLLAALIQRPDDMLSSPLGKHILNYELPASFPFQLSPRSMAQLTPMITYFTTISK